MELVGEEKKIQALFSQARLADEQITPSFVGVWNRAQAKTVRTHRAFNLSFVAATALLVCALVSLAWWSTRWQRNPDTIAVAPPSSAPLTVPLTVGGENGNVNSAPPVKSAPRIDRRVSSSSTKSRALKLAAPSEALLLAADRRATKDAQALASWQSPTATLLESPSDGLLKSLPQLNHSVDELKAILPNQPK